jgi:uncharacterized protein
LFAAPEADKLLMTDIPSSHEPEADRTPEVIPQPETGATVPVEPKQAPLEEYVTKAFVGRNGIRAGWRLLIFVCLFGGLFALFGAIIIALNHHKIPGVDELTPRSAILSEGFQLVCVLLASWIMSKIEARTMADYGLPARQAFGGKFWIGLPIGFASITILLVALRTAHVFYFGTIGLQGTQILKYAGLWGLAFLCVGFFEELFFRGYALFTVTTGTTFWPAAVLLSGVFGYVHHSNQGESWVGAFNAGLFGFVLCLIIRRTGNLWMPIGFHAAWDWAETYFYGVADSGLVARGHLYNSKLLLQPAWLSGGTVGPEGSWLCTILLVLLFIVFAATLRQVNYPNEAAIPDPRKKKVSSSRLFPAEENPPAQV